MHALKKKWSAALSVMLVLVMLATMAVMPDTAKAAQGTDFGFDAITVEANNITVTGTEKVYVDTMKNGKAKTTDVYTKGKNGDVEIDLSYINGKGAELQVYKNADAKITVDVEKQVKKVKATFSVLKKELTVVSEAKGDYCIVLGSDMSIASGAGMENIDYDKYMVKGATGYVYYPATVTKKSDGEYTITPESKQGKFKIPARKAGPKIALDIDTLSFKAPGGCTYKISEASKGAVEYELASTGEISVSSTAKVSFADENEKVKENKIDITKKDITIELWKDASGSRPASKISELRVPKQSLINDVSGGGITYTVGYKRVRIRPDVDDDVEDWGPEDYWDEVPVSYIVKNETGKACQLAWVDKETSPASIDLLAAKIKWKKVKSGGSTVYKINRVEGKKLLYRIAGEKPGKKNNNTLTLPSTIGVIKPMVAFDYINVFCYEPTDAEISGKTASRTAIEIKSKPGEGAYYYKLLNDNKDAVQPKIGDRLPDGASEIEVGKRVIFESLTSKSAIQVYEIDSDSDIIGYRELFFNGYYSKYLK